ncbi:MAG: hemerythrin domain-containing protein [bacterium]|nr:hemerythrin domain-containing protein [bacterium]
MDSQKPSVSRIRDRFLADHRELRGKAAVVTTLALNVLRGDEELASALRLKGEELNDRLLSHMAWEEKHLIPLLAHTPRGKLQGKAILEEHKDQRTRLLDSLTELQRPQNSFSGLAKECLALVHWLEADMASEERDVLDAIADLDS